MKPMRILSLISVLCGLVVASCAGPAPIEEYTLARAAVEAAREVGAPSSSPGFWHRAEESYRKGKRAFEDNDASLAKAHFDKAKEYAEKAENSTRLKSFQSGEGFP